MKGFKSVIDKAPDEFKIPYTELKPEINWFIQTKWQKCWNNNIHNKILIEPSLGDQHSENRERNKSLYPYYTLVTQDLHIPIYSNKNNNLNL